MRLQIDCIAPYDLGAYWSRVEPLFARMYTKDYGDISLDQLHAQIASGHLYLLVLRDGLSDYIALACAVRFIDYRDPQRTVAHVEALGGRDTNIPGAFESLLEFARTMGATEMRAWVDDVGARWLRRYGFKKQCNVVRRPI